MVDDYAHHPTEVRATLEAARTLAPAAAGRGLPAAPVLAHAAPGARVRRRARARRPAGGDRRSTRRASAPRTIPGVTGRLVAEAAADAAGGRRVAWLPDFDSAERFLRAELREGDLLLTLGAGDIDALGRRLVGPGRTPGG